MKNFYLLLGLAAMAIPAHSEVLTELPDGLTTNVYSRTATATRPYGEGTVKSWIESSTTDIAVSATGEVFMKNAVGNYTQGYIKGKLINGVITVDLPQQILFYDEEVNVTLLDFNDEDATYAAKTGNVTFNVNGDKIRLAGDGVILGMVDHSNDWVGYALEDISYIRIIQELVEVPDDAEFFDLALRYTDDQPLPVIPTFTEMLHGARKGDEIYVQGLATFLPDAWVKGKVTDGKVEFKSGQLLGSAYDMHFYFCTGIDSPEYIPGYNEWEHHYSITSSMTLNLTTDGEMTVNDPNETFIINGNPSEYAYGVILRNPVLRQQPKDICQLPAAPTFIKDLNICKEGLNAQFTFNASPYNVDGYLLDTRHLAFVVYVKGLPYTFEAYKFWLEEDMTEVPWGFDMGDVVFYINGYADISFPEDERIYDMTVRVVNRTPDGNEYWSEILDPFNPHSSVEVATEDPVDTGWFDLSGRPVGDKATGCLIKRSIMPDGTIRTSKVIR